MTASYALMLPALSTSLDQVQARRVECIFTACSHSYITFTRSKTVFPAAADFTCFDS